MKRIQTVQKGKAFFIIFGTFFLLILTISSGCGNKFFDPTQIGRFRPTPAVNVILDTLGVAEEEQKGWEGAEDPRPEDTRLVETDYVFNPGDIVRISIFELYREGEPVLNDYIVTETGKISIPDVGVIQAAGATEIQLEEEIRQILSPSILRNPSVAVTMISSQQRSYSILGDGVEIPGRYVIPRYDFRLTDALATARGPRQFNVSYIYVSRHTRGIGLMDEPMKFEVIEPEFTEPGITAPELTEPTFTLPGLTEPEITGIEDIRLPELNEQGFEFTEPIMEDLIEPEKEWLEVITPLAQHEWPESKVVIASAELATEREQVDMDWPNVVEPSRSSKQQWGEPEPEPSLGLTDSERTDKPVSIQDILKTLSSRARQERVDEQIDIEETPESFTEPIAPETFEEPIDIEEALRSFGEPSALEVPGIIEEPIDIRMDIPEPTFEPIVPEGIEEQGGEGRIEWIFQDGKWIPIQVGPPVQPELPSQVIEIEPRGAIELPGELVAPGFEWAEQSPTRVIKIPTDKLLAGNPRYNILIKPGDSIHVPVDIIGEFCIMGNVNYQGYINITGRPMTLKMAIAAAGGLDALAWPKHCEVVRRIGEDKEEIVMVDLDKIASGEQPDFFIKPNDLINVGTHPTSIWRAVLRNAFRATYGFGFIYDRNFAYADWNYGTTFMGMKQ